MWYWILAALATIYVYWDANRRGNKAWGWSLPTIFLWPIIVPIYRSKRFLLKGEQRVGGTTWALLKSFVVLWQVFCIAWLSSYGVEISTTVEEASTEAESAGAAIGGTLGIGFIIGAWVGITVIVGILGLFFKGGKVEEGPTGPNAKTETSQNS